VNAASDNGIEEAINEAAKVIKEGGIAAFPTETVYGIGCDYENEEALARLREIKKRPPDKPFTAHVGSISAVKKSGCIITRNAEKLMKHFWPGPLTLLLAGPSGKKAFRMPLNPVALGIIRQSGCFVALPSANLSGDKPPADAEAVIRDFGGRIQLIVDGGPVRGKESTVIDLTAEPPVIAREGAVSREEIEEVLGKEIA